MIRFWVSCDDLGSMVRGLKAGFVKNYKDFPRRARSKIMLIKRVHCFATYASALIGKPCRVMSVSIKITRKEGVFST